MRSRHPGDRSIVILRFSLNTSRRGFGSAIRIPSQATALWMHTLYFEFF
jgi:hypothetical protein